MKKTKKLIAILFTLLILFHTNATALITDTKPIGKNTKSDLFNFEDPQYAILTEEYQIDYTTNNNGNIVISNDNYIELLNLLSDRNSVEKILNAKNAVARSHSKGSELYTFSAIKNNKLLDSLKSSKYLENESDNIVINETSIINSVSDLTNFTSEIQLGELVYTSTGVNITANYIWVWQYQPLFTLTDIVAITWSDRFDSDGRDVGFLYMPSGHHTTLGGLTNDYEDTDYLMMSYMGDDAYSGYEDGIGFQNKFNIVRSFEKNSKTYRVDQHAGIYQVKLVRSVYPSDDDGSITIRGNYFHQVVKPDITLELTADNFGLGLWGDLRYDYNEPVVRMINYR